MTRSLVRPTAEIMDTVPSPHLTHDLDTPPILNTTDGCVVGQSFSTVIETLANTTEQCDSDGYRVIGDMRGSYIACQTGHEENKNGGVVDVHRIQVVDRLRGVSFDYRGESLPGNEHFRVYEEGVGTSQTAIFTEELNGSELSPEAARLSQDLAETLFDVAKRQDEIDSATLSDIKEVLTTPDTQPSQLKKWFNGAVLHRLIGRYRTPAA